MVYMFVLFSYLISVIGKPGSSMVAPQSSSADSPGTSSRSITADPPGTALQSSPSYLPRSSSNFRFDDLPETSSMSGCADLPEITPQSLLSKLRMSYTPSYAYIHQIVYHVIFQGNE